MFRDGEFADIVEQRAGPQGVKLLLAKAVSQPDPDRVDLRSANVADADLVAGIDRRRQGLDRCQVKPVGIDELFRLLRQPYDMDPVCKVAKQNGRNNHKRKGVSKMAKGR